MQCKTIAINDISDKLPGDLSSPNRQTRALVSISKIVVHYDAVRVPPMSNGKLGYDPVARYVEQARYHMHKNWNEGGGPPVYGFGLMYHYRVSADGRLWRTQPERLITWHARAANNVGLAVCCDLGPGQSPPEDQLAGLNTLLHWLCHERPDIPAGQADVWGHGELRKAGNSTTCPGGLLEWVQRYRGRA